MSGKRFTFLRMISHPEPPKYSGDKNDIDLTRQQLDNLVGYQIGLPTPRYLTNGSFFVAGLTDSKVTSEKIYKALCKASIIPAAPVDPSSAPVTTANISNKFTKQLPFISEYARRKLVGMLFFWEEQCTRWRLLDEEESEILYAMGQDGVDGQQLEVALQTVQMKRRLLPSQVQT